MPLEEASEGRLRLSDEEEIGGGELSERRRILFCRDLLMRAEEEKSQVNSFVFVFVDY